MVILVLDYFFKWMIQNENEASLAMIWGFKNVCNSCGKFSHGLGK